MFEEKLDNTWSKYNSEQALIPDFSSLRLVSTGDEKHASIDFEIDAMLQKEH